MEQKQEHIFFEGINGLRFFAALAVIITHIELIKAAFGIKNYWQNTFVFNLGGLGVYFFFVLSGFLITYLLLIEKQKTTTIAIKKFYWRRVLRIWPLYYLIVLIGFFILPHFQLFHISYLQDSFNQNFNSNLWLYLFILPNLAFSMYAAVPNIGQTWSIGVEEQFYIIWPWVIKKSNNILKTLIMIIVGLVVMKIFVLMLGKIYSNERWYSILKTVVAMSKFECMAIGGVGAYYLYHQHLWLNYITKPYVAVVSLLFILASLYILPSFLQDGQHLILALLFLIIILNVAITKINWLQHSVFDFLGRISYGLYMYHLMLIPLMLFIIKKIVPETNGVFFNIILYVSTLSSTVIVASASYYLVELKFVKLKEKFSVIKSGGV